MPRLNGAGPAGYGPGTGWGGGPCGAGGISRGAASKGWSWRRFYTKKEEVGLLEEEAQELGEELKAINERLVELKSQK